MARSSTQSPYNGFKDDKERRKALISRDIRLVLIATIGAFAGVLTHWHEVSVWLKSFL